MANTTDPNVPNYVRKELADVAKDLELADDLLNHTRRMHDKSKTYIRKWRDEDQAVYDIRRQCETLFEGYARTLEASVGMMFATPPSIEWNGAEVQMSPDFDNLDGRGTKWHVFAKRFADRALAGGCALILVDHPPAPIDPATGRPVQITEANEVALGLRPTWAAYSRDQVLSWRTEVIANRETLTQLVLFEPGDTPAGRFGVKPRRRYRVLRLDAGVATWELYEQRGGDGSSAVDYASDGARPFRNRKGDIASFLPVAVGYTGRSSAPLVADMPLQGVAWANLAHWQIATDLRFNRSVCGFEQLVVSGAIMSQAGVDTAGNPTSIPGKLRIGPLVAIHVESGGSVKWEGPSGAGLASLEKGAQEKLTAIAAQGMAFLSADFRAVETAASKKIDATAEQATIATAAQGVEDALNLAAEYHAWYRGIAKDAAPVVTMNRDYEDTTLAADVMTAYIKAVVDAGLPARVLIEAMIRGGRLPEDTDVAALEMEMTSNAAAAAAHARDLAAANAAGGVLDSPEVPNPSTLTGA